MKKKFYLGILIVSVLFLITPIIDTSEASEKIELGESSSAVQISNKILATLKNIDGLIYQVGSRGVGVKEFQSLLINSGYTSIGKADGRYGNRTATAVTKFQTSAKLPVTGKSDVITQFMLVLQNNSFVRNGNVYTAKKHNCVVIFWSEKAFYIGVTNDAGDFVVGQTV